MAVMVRSILEIRIAFFYLCIEQCSPEEWNCRWNLFNLHDCTSRRRLFEEMSDTERETAGFDAQAAELRSRLAGNTFFMSLPEVRRRRLLKGRESYLSPLADIAARAGVGDLRTFRWLYRLLSSHVHGLPLSFYRMGEQERGRGVYSTVEEGYAALCLSFAIKLLVGARDEMQQLFSAARGLEERGGRDEPVAPDRIPRMQEFSGNEADHGGPDKDIDWLREPGIVLRELGSTAVLLLLEGCFLCLWAAVVWGVTEVLSQIQPRMPPWAPELFKYVDIGFALFILAKLFLARAQVFETAIRRAWSVLAILRRGFSRPD
jgi:hypothetical protein